MKRVLILALAIGLGGCAKEVAEFKTAVKVLSSASVSPQQILIAANAFDGLKAGGTEYLVYCKSHITTDICSADNRRLVIRVGRSGAKARDKLEPYIISGGAGPKALYDSLISATESLKASPAASFGVVK